MANAETQEILKRLMQRLLRDEFSNLSPQERQAFESQFEERFRELVEAGAKQGMSSFSDIIGLGTDGLKTVRRAAVAQPQGRLRRIRHALADLRRPPSSTSSSSTSA